MEMTEEERREMMRSNYAAQMNMLGYSADGNPKDIVEIVCCKDCDNKKQWKQEENVIYGIDGKLYMLDCFKRRMDDA